MWRAYAFSLPPRLAQSSFSRSSASAWRMASALRAKSGDFGSIVERRMDIINPY
jgi:hypothetical protein